MTGNEDATMSVIKHPCKQYSYFNMKNSYSISDNPIKYDKGALRSPLPVRQTAREKPGKRKI